MEKDLAMEKNFLVMKKCIMGLYAKKYLKIFKNIIKIKKIYI